MRIASGVMPAMWNSATEPKLASAAPKCFISSEPGMRSMPTSARNLPVIAGKPTDDAAKRAPVAEITRRRGDLDDERRLPPRIEMDTRSAACGR